MKPKPQPPDRREAYRSCKRCVFNDYEKCGRMLCVLPHCVNRKVRRAMDAEAKDKDV